MLLSQDLRASRMSWQMWLKIRNESSLGENMGKDQNRIMMLCHQLWVLPLRGDGSNTWRTVARPCQRLLSSLEVHLKCLRLSWTPPSLQPPPLRFAKGSKELNGEVRTREQTNKTKYLHKKYISCVNMEGRGQPGPGSATLLIDKMTTMTPKWTIQLLSSTK